MNFWLEYNEILMPTLRVFAPHGSCDMGDRRGIQLEVAGPAGAVVTVDLAEPIGDKEMKFVPSKEGIDMIQLCSKVVLPPLTEDWSQPWNVVQCGQCEAVLATSDLEALILPSATWGFEDMRVCEECGPMACGGRKRGRKGFFLLDQFNLYFQGAGCGCGDRLEGAAMERIKSVAGGWETCTRYPKFATTGPAFLRFYNPRSEEVATTIVGNDWIKILSPGVVLMTPDGVQPATRIVVNMNTQLGQRFASENCLLSPSEMCPLPGWRVGLVRVPPQLVDK